MLCLFLVQTCAKVYFKAKRIEKEKVTKVDNTTYEYRDNTSELKRKIGNNLDDADVLEKMSTTTDIDEKLRILTYNMNKNLPLNLGDMVLSKVEQLENREIRYRYIMLGDVSAISNTQWDNYKEYFNKLNRLVLKDERFNIDLTNKDEELGYINILFKEKPYYKRLGYETLEEYKEELQEIEGYSKKGKKNSHGFNDVLGDIYYTELMYNDEFYKKNEFKNENRWTH